MNARGRQPRGGLHSGLIRVGAGHYHQLDVFGGFSASVTTCVKTLVSSSEKIWSVSSGCSPEPACVTRRTESNTISSLSVSVLAKAKRSGVYECRECGKQKVAQSGKRIAPCSCGGGSWNLVTATSKDSKKKKGFLSSLFG